MSATTKRPMADLTSEFSYRFQQIAAAKATLIQLEDKASEIGDEIMKGYGKGPHPVQIPNPKDTTKTRTLVVVFQRVSKAVRFESTDVTDLVNNASHTPPPPPFQEPPPAPPSEPQDLNVPPPPPPLDGDPLARIKAAQAG